MAGTSGSSDLVRKLTRQAVAQRANQRAAVDHWVEQLRRRARGVLVLTQSMPLDQLERFKAVWRDMMEPKP